MTAHHRLPALIQRVGGATEDTISPSEERLLKAAPARWREHVDAREQLSHVSLAIGFALACGALIAGFGAELPEAGPAVALALAFAVLSRVEFNAGSGYTDPTQLVFVPMLFLVASVWAPVLVAGGLTLGLLHKVTSGQMHVSRLLSGPVNAWYALGPALVFAFADVGAPSLGDWPIYLLALAAQFAADFVAGAVSESISLGVKPDLQLRVMLPIWRIDLLLSAIGLMAALATHEHAYAFLLVLPLGALMAVFARDHRARIDQSIELSCAYRNTALLLGDVIEGDDAYTGEHSRSVVSLAIRISGELDLDEDELRLVELGALLHDVGKIAIPKAIINKQGPLDATEWDVVRRHTLVGQQMLDRVGGALGEIGAIVRSSHEHFDGGGYPDGTAREAIPLASRIVAVADAYSAMTTDRPYRDALPEAEAVRRLLAGSGSQFDPVIVDALVVVLMDRAPGRTAPVPRPPSSSDYSSVAPPS